MLRYARGRAGMTAQLISIGALIDGQLARACVECRLDNLKISRNAGRPETYPQIHGTESEENYLKVKSNLPTVADLKSESGSALPWIALSYCNGARNYREIEELVRATHEVGAQKAMFSHTVVSDDTHNLMLSRDQYRALRESTVVAERLAADFSIQNNMAVLRDEVPSYLGEEGMAGPATVPCYAGWYFAFVLDNGAVMFCCQCSVAVNQITEERRFRDIWNDHTYREYRKAARDLPAKTSLPNSCECDRYALRRRNLAIHNLVRPFDRIDCGNELKTFSLADIGRRFKGIKGKQRRIGVAASRRTTAKRSATR